MLRITHFDKWRGGLFLPGWGFEAIILPDEVEELAGSSAANRCPSHQLPIKRMATEAARTQRLRE